MRGRKCITMSKNLVFTGLMGTGKTTIGKLVAIGLGREFIDTDQFLEESYGPAQKILKKPSGDQAFRTIEEAIAEELASRKQLVIATGGRFCLNPKNVAALSKNSIFLCLNAPLETLVSRLTAADQDTYRPKFIAAENKLQLMRDLETLSKPHFRDFEQISTTGRAPQAVAEELIQRFC